MLGNVGPWELILILVIVLVVFGPGKLPQIGESMGKAMQNFKKASQGKAPEEDKLS
jgi:sec-independent protein translocase protein TatA